MITVEELASLPLFASVPADCLAEFAGMVADIRLVPGEYVIHEGEARSLIVTVEGELEVTKLVDGQEKVIGHRPRGHLFGEVPMMLGTPFPASMRAMTAARVIQIDVRDFHFLCAAAPQVSAMVGAAALTRIDGLRNIAEAAPTSQLTVIGPRWDDRVHVLRSFLHSSQVAFDWVTPAQGEENTVAYPIVRLPDGLEMSAPTNREVASALGLAIRPGHEHYDVVIVGGGPAGMAAAVYGVSEGLRTLLVEKMAPGGQAGTSSRIENYLGFPFGLGGDDLANRALTQARRLGAEVIVTRHVEAIDTDRRTLTLDGGEVIQARSIILSMGVAWRRMAVEDLERWRRRRRKRTVDRRVQAPHASALPSASGVGLRAQGADPGRGRSGR